jgi:hypothetical protein
MKTRVCLTLLKREKYLGSVDIFLIIGNEHKNISLIFKKVLY